MHVYQNYSTKDLRTGTILRSDMFKNENNDTRYVPVNYSNTIK